MDIDTKPTLDERKELLYAIVFTLITVALFVTMFTRHIWWFGLIIPFQVFQAALAFRGWKIERGERIARRNAFQTWRERLSSTPPPPMP
jgi:hypothetical protein